LGATGSENVSMILSLIAHTEHLLS